jgi:hypothetical protein
MTVAVLRPKLKKGEAHASLFLCLKDGLLKNNIALPDWRLC